ncbi:MAG: TIM barrel protein [Acidimicrobiia bacterium]|nr:TIM barrel protein [Acidimicrobiia bacterium]MYG71949.1 TIM barrel protein [Acidimicrobiia bacterium]
MSHPPYLCTGTLGRVPWDEKARAASAAGFARLSIYGWEHRKLHERGWDDAAIVSLLHELNLRVAEYDGVVMTMRSPEGAEDAVAAAAALGARSITVLEHSDWQPGEHLDQAAATLAEIADQAAEHGILALIEPFSWSPLDDHRVAAEIVERADRPNAGLLLDTWHLWRGPEQGRLNTVVDPAMINAIQVGDTGPDPVGQQAPEEIAYECIHHRLMPGDGHGNIADLLADLVGRGVDAPLAIEVFSDELNALDPEAVAHKSMACFKKLNARLAP